jgi:hypothetical protein
MIVSLFPLMKRSVRAAVPAHDGKRDGLISKWHLDSAIGIDCLDCWVFSK